MVFYELCYQFVCDTFILTEQWGIMYFYLIEIFVDFPLLYHQVLQDYYNVYHPNYVSPQLKSRIDKCYIVV